MSKNNTVILRGNLADDPYTQKMSDGTPYLRFFLVVEREGGLSHNHGGDPQRADLIRVVEFGPRAELDYHYLRKGAETVVFGRLHSRAYKDLRSGVETRRNQLEVVTQFIVCGRGCDMDQGDRHRDEMAERGGEDAAVAAGVSVIVPKHLLKMLSADAE